jgi:hypothetical protein
MPGVSGRAPGRGTLMAAVELSESALALLRLHFEGFSLRMGTSNPDSLPGLTLEETRAAYGELTAAGLMTLIDMSGDQQSSRYWLTLAGMDRKSALLTPARSSPAGSAKEPAAHTG